MLDAEPAGCGFRRAMPSISHSRRPDGPGEVADVLAITFERETAQGTSWCLPQDAVAVRRWVVDQGRELGGALRRLVRLVSVLAQAQERGVVEFLYLRIKSLRAAEFRAALEANRNLGRREGAPFSLTAKGVIIREAGRDFEIDYLQMPRIGALLDILHNALGYAVVADVLAPVTAASAEAPYETVAHDLEQAFASWLKVRLETRHHLRQAQALRAYLAARGAVVPDAITDATIFEFWRANATNREPGPVDGYRLYVNAVRAMLGYRQALADAILESRLRAPESLLEGHHDDRGAAAEEEVANWVSPLAPLFANSQAEVKWLTAKECRALANYLGEWAPTTNEIEGDGNEGQQQWVPGLAGDRPFDLRFCRTLLRADVFGKAQASIVARRQKKHPGSVSQVMGAIGRDAYRAGAAIYEEIGDQLRLEALAALQILACAGAAEAMLLVYALGGPEAVQAVRACARPLTAGSMAEELSADAMGMAAAQAALDPTRLETRAGRSLFEEARASLRKVRRAGFDAAASPEVISSLKAAASLLPDLIEEIQRLRRALDRSPWVAEALTDRAAFERVFADMYGDGSNPPEVAAQNTRG